MFMLQFRENFYQLTLEQPIQTRFCVTNATENALVPQAGILQYTAFLTIQQRSYFAVIVAITTHSTTLPKNSKRYEVVHAKCIYFSSPLRFTLIIASYFVQLQAGLRTRSIFIELKFEFEFNIFIFSSSSSAKIYEVFLSSENKVMIDLA